MRTNHVLEKYQTALPQDAEMLPSGVKVLSGKSTEIRNIWAAQEQTIGRNNCQLYKFLLFRGLSTTTGRFHLMKSPLLGCCSKNYLVGRRYRFYLVQKLVEILEFQNF